jgi:predicted DNA-binding protein YlxM (UPF0122 family)
MDISELPKDQKVALAQVMLDLNYSATEIAKELNIDRTTVYRYGEKTLNDDLQQFATEMKIIFTLKQRQILAKILTRIEQALWKSDIRGLILAFEVLSRHTPTLHQIFKDARHEQKFGRVLDFT